MATDFSRRDCALLAGAAALAGAGAVMAGGAQPASAQPASAQPASTAMQRADDLLRQMTVEEKAMQLSSVVSCRWRCSAPTARSAASSTPSWGTPSGTSPDWA
jgi:hypothetical protein